MQLSVNLFVHLCIDTNATDEASYQPRELYIKGVLMSSDAISAEERPIIIKLTKFMVSVSAILID